MTQHKHTHDTLVLPPRTGIARAPRKGMEVVDLRDLGILAAMAGGDGQVGFNTLGDVLTQTIDGRDLNEIWAEFQAAVALRNERRQRLIDLLTFPVTQPIEDVPQISTNDFEEASEFGEPKGIHGGAYFSLGYDFKWYDLAIRYTWMFLSEAMAAQVDALHNMALEADSRLIFSKVMKAVFDNRDRTATIRLQAINVYPFYNNDGTVPPDYKGYTHTGAHDHYLTSGGATIDSGDLDDMETHLVHHGYGKQAGASLFLLCNRAQTATLRTFRVSAGDSYDFIPALGQPPFILPVSQGVIQGGQPNASWQGLDVRGVYGPWTIIEEDYIPEGYVLGFATGGEMQATNPVGFREHANAALRGMRLVKGRDADYPLIDSFYSRGFGTGCRHRGAAIVMQIKAQAGYVIPPEYA
jgi:hypothetical protein